MGRMVRMVKKEYLRRTQFLNAQLGQPLSLIDSLLQANTADQTSNEATGKGITSTSGVVDLGLLNGVNGDLLDLLAVDSHDGGVSSLGDDSNTLSLLVLLWQSSEVLGNLLDVLGLQTVALSVRERLRLVTNHVIPVRCDGIKGILEELRDEWGREGEDEGLVVLSGLLGQLLDGRWAHGQVVATDKVVGGSLDELPDLGRLQVLEIVVVGGAQVGDHGAVVVGDDNSTAAGGLLGVDAVLNSETGLLDCIVQDCGILVVTDTAEEDSAVGWKQVLGSSSSVLGTTSGNEFGGVVV